MCPNLRKAILLAGLLLSLAAVSYGQSLGDVAREQRQKKQQSSQTAPKVITNDDLPSDGDKDAEPAADAPYDESASHPLGSKSGEQWKAEIAAQKNKVASLQSQIDRLSSSIHFAPGNCVRNCVQYNERQVQKQDEVQRLQGQLEEAKTKLEDMQEAARQEGFGNAVWEP